MGWTRRNAAVSVILAMEEHRKQAGQRLAALRESQGLGQEELAHLAGISVKTISRFENGRHDGRRSTIRALAKALNVNEHDIVGPPPDPLGMGESQLDRIEDLLREVLQLLEPEPDEELSDPPDDEQPKRTAATSRRTVQKRKAS